MKEANTVGVGDGVVVRNEAGDADSFYLWCNTCSVYLMQVLNLTNDRRSGVMMGVRANAVSHVKTSKSPYHELVLKAIK